MNDDERVWDVVGWQEFLISLPDEYRTLEVKKQLRFWYHREIESLIDYVNILRKSGKPYYAYFGRIEKTSGSSQMIAHFSVKDLSKIYEPQQVNWHLQNTSQWVYAGALVVDIHAFERKDERIVSTHH